MTAGDGRCFHDPGFVEAVASGAQQIQYGTRGERRCSADERVVDAPNKITGDTKVASSGTSGPNGTTKAAGRASCVKRLWRSLKVATDTPVYVSNRATALAANNIVNDPHSARTRATVEVNQIAFAGV